MCRISKRVDVVWILTFREESKNKDTEGDHFGESGTGFTNEKESGTVTAEFDSETDDDKGEDEAESRSVTEYKNLNTPFPFSLEDQMKSHR